jgi:hypothetical protein
MKAELDLLSGDETANFIAVPEGKEIYLQVRDNTQLIVMNINKNDMYKMRAYLNYVLEMYK